MPRMALDAASASSIDLGDLDAAALAAAAGVDLRLHHDGLVAFAEERLGGLVGLFERGGHLALGHGHAVLPQDVFRLILVNLHGCCLGRAKRCTARTPDTKGWAESAAIFRWRLSACTFANDIGTPHLPDSSPHQRGRARRTIDRAASRRARIDDRYQHGLVALGHLKDRDLCHAARVGVVDGD